MRAPGAAPALLNAIDRMMPMLRFFRHGDGTFALFNGMGPTPPDLIATVIAYDDMRGATVTNALHSGYQRVEMNDTSSSMPVSRPPSTQQRSPCRMSGLRDELAASAWW